MSESTKHLQPFEGKEPFNSGYLEVTDLHKLYFEESGKPSGKPVIFIHGGPGVGSMPYNKSFFDPEVYRIILLDQRGAGKSTPPAELKENTTWDLVEDLEKLRKHLNIDKWILFGGSWGSALSLCYAETHPDRVKALIISGIFTFRRCELEWFYEGGGANMIYPDEWEKFIEPIPEPERYDMIGAYHRRLTGEDEAVRKVVASSWSRWELSALRLYPDEELISRAQMETWCIQIASIECHYFVHSCFLEEGYLFKNIDKIRHIPATIVQGRYDIVCPVETAWKLHRAWPEADFHIVQDAGHLEIESGLMQKLLETTDKYKHL